jgi:hypothetical protein
MPAPIRSESLATRALTPKTVLALQRTAGNSAVTRLLLRAPLDKVMRPEHKFFVGYEGVGYYREKGLPGGFHVTIYPDNLTGPQSTAAADNKRLSDLPDPGKISFTKFNVTKGRGGTHFYFDERGNVLWQHTNKEASMEDDDWQYAVAAALVIYAEIGVAITEQQIYDHLHVVHKRKKPVSARDTWTPPPPPPPISVEGLETFIPPSLRRPKPAAKLKPKPKPAAAPTDVPMPTVVSHRRTAEEAFSVPESKTEETGSLVGVQAPPTVEESEKRRRTGEDDE